MSTANELASMATKDDDTTEAPKKPATSPQSGVRMLTKSEIESLQRDKRESAAWMDGFRSRA